MTHGAQLRASKHWDRSRESQGETDTDKPNYKAEYEVPDNVKGLSRNI